MDPQTTPCLLALDGRTRTVQKAELSIQVNHGSGMLSPDGDPSRATLLWGLYVTVDEHSGEDGAAAPCIQTIPIRRREGRYPLLHELTGSVIDDPDDLAWDAWFGNDAPSLDGNWLQFGEWVDGALEVRWRANWSVSPRATTHTVEFRGFVTFGGVELLVTDEAHLRPIVEALWGEGFLDTFEVARAPWTEKTEHIERYRKLTLWPRAIARPAGTPP